MKKIVVNAPAKLNLALDITGTAPNGYHLVDMIMQTVNLYEQVEIVKSAGYSLRCPRSRVPTNDKNTATKAAMAFFHETGLLAGADITIKKVVPTRAGMAGGSADAAAVLVGLNELYNAHLTPGELCEIGLKVGADVPFIIRGGTARVTGIGEIIEPLPLLPACWFTVAMPPGGGVSTPLAYTRYDEMGTPTHPPMDTITRAILSRNLAGLAADMGNALEYSNGGLHTTKIRHILDASGALSSMMTGSGAAVFGVFTSEQAALQARNKLRNIAEQVFILQPVEHGAQVVARC